MSGSDTREETDTQSNIVNVHRKEILKDKITNIHESKPNNDSSEALPRRSKMPILNTPNNLATTKRSKEVKEEIYNSRNYTIFRPYATSNNQIDENSHNSVPPLLIDFILNEREFVFSTLPFFLVDYNLIVYTALSNYNISLQFRSRYNHSIL